MLDEVLENLKKGRPQSILVEGDWTAEQLRRAVPALFEVCRNGGLADLNGEEPLESEFYPFGDESEEIKGFRVKGPRANYDRQILYFDPGNSPDFVMREKIYLTAESFLDCADFWQREELKIIPEVYAQAEQTADGLSRGLLRTLEHTDKHDQLMFIRYTTSAIEPDIQKKLAAFSANRLGVNHDDETFFSLHLYESSPELYSWGYEEKKWIPRIDKPDRAEILLGDFARWAGYPPSTHRLIPSRGGTENGIRYSLIFERGLAEGVDKKILEPEFFRQAPPASFEKTDKVALCIIKSGRWNSWSAEVEKLTEEHLRVWLYFRFRSFKNRIFMVDPKEPNMAGIESKGFNRALLIESGFLLEGESYFDQLLRNSHVFNEKILFKLDRRYGPCCLMANLKEGNSHLLDAIALKHGWENLTNELPTHLDTLSGNGDGRAFHMRQFGRNLPLGEPIKVRQNILREHLEQGFAHAFIFNNESYREIDRSPPPVTTRDLFGLASGFKMHYLLERSPGSIRTLNYLDLNTPALKIKKRMFETWGGQNLPDWLILHGFIGGETRWTFEKDIETVRRLWNRELDLWGGASQFLGNWRKYKTLDVTFDHMDLVQEQDRFLRLIRKDSLGALWISNVWHNEFMGHAFPDEQLAMAYRDWLKKLAEFAPQMILYQGNVNLDNQVLETTGRPVRDVYSDCLSLMTAAEEFA